MGVGDKTPDVLSFDGTLPCQCILAFMHSSLAVLVLVFPKKFQMLINEKGILKHQAIRLRRSLLGFFSPSFSDHFT